MLPILHKYDFNSLLERYLLWLDSDAQQLNTVDSEPNYVLRFASGIGNMWVHVPS